MLTMDRRSGGLRGPAVAAVIGAALMIFPAGTAAMDQTTGDLEPAAGDPSSVDPTVAELRVAVDDLSSRNDALIADNETLQRTVDSLSTERDRLQESLERFDDLYAPLEADRQLLFELRKGVPETRAEAETQLERIRRLALSSNPSSLGQLIDRVDAAAPTFFDWRYADHASPQEANLEYINSGANAYDSTMEEFRDAVLMSVANRLDGLLNVIDRAR